MNKTQTLRRCATLLCLLTAALSSSAQTPASASLAKAHAHAASGAQTQAVVNRPAAGRAAAAHQSCRRVANAHHFSHSQCTAQASGGTGSPIQVARIWFSDERLKHDIALLERLPSGLGLYAYRYVWSDTVYVGVMAQEVAAVMPEAVTKSRDGFFAVDYRRLGLELVTLEQWVAAQRQ